jgi:hypothetical protein
MIQINNEEKVRGSSSGFENENKGLRLEAEVTVDMTLLSLLI